MFYICIYIYLYVHTIYLTFCGFEDFQQWGCSRLVWKKKSNVTVASVCAQNCNNLLLYNSGARWLFCLMDLMVVKCLCGFAALHCHSNIHPYGSCNCRVTRHSCLWHHAAQVDRIIVVVVVDGCDHRFHFDVIAASHRHRVRELHYTHTSAQYTIQLLGQCTAMRY